ncbi:MAG: putative lipid II flippase FtsW [Clostridiales Family XIII bacterium]|jgi:cell division protein FtsW|nr:putative lipid II flippase FtsW [Clostridiales Family XIII bacterium]
MGDREKNGENLIKSVGVRGDFFLLVLVLILTVFGVIMVFSASYYGTIDANIGPYHYLFRSAFWASAGFVFMIALMFVPYKIYRSLAPFALVGGILLLCALFTPLGHTVNYATRWIKVGSTTFMPGEIVKITSIWFVAWYCTKYRRQIRSFKRGTLPIAALLIVNFILIYMQPNLSTALIVCGIILAMFFFAGGNILHIAGMLGAAGGIVFALILTNDGGEHKNRLMGYWDPFADAQGEFYQLCQSILALGAGGVTGAGPGRSVQKALYLPEAQNDFIFAIIGEELGFIGCIALLIVYLLLIWRCMLVALNAPDRFAMLTAAGVTVMLALQVVMNIGVVTGLLPPTGVTLPLVSYGGNAILLFMGSMGIMMNISRMSERPPRNKKKKKEKKRNRKLKAAGAPQTEAAV